MNLIKNVNIEHEHSKKYIRDALKKFISQFLINIIYIILV